MRCCTTVFGGTGPKKLMSAQQWNEAVHQIGHEWQKAADTKSGKHQAHTAAPLIEFSKVVNVAQSAAAGTQNRFNLN